MAKLSSSGADGMMDELRRLDAAVRGPVMQQMLDAGAEEVKKAWQATADRYGYRDSGEMIASIAPAKGRDSDIYREIYPQGKDSRTGVRNAEKAFLLHYGTSRIKASYWVDEAEAEAEGPMEAAMQRVLDEALASMTN